MDTCLGTAFKEEKPGQVLIQKRELPTASCLPQQKPLTLPLSNVENLIPLGFEKAVIHQTMPCSFRFLFSKLFFFFSLFCSVSLKLIVITGRLIIETLQDDLKEITTSSEYFAYQFENKTLQRRPLSRLLAE